MEYTILVIVRSLSAVFLELVLTATVRSRQ